MNTDSVLFFDIFKYASIKTHPKHALTSLKASGFYLNPSHSKTQAFTCLKTYLNGRSKENEKILKNLLIRSLHLLKDDLVAYMSLEGTHSDLPLRSNG